MGIFFYTHSVAFVEDLKLKDNSTYSSEDELLNDMEEAYQQVFWGSTIFCDA